MNIFDRAVGKKTIELKARVVAGPNTFVHIGKDGQYLSDPINVGVTGSNNRGISYG